MLHLILFLILEPLKRILSAVFYPWVYLLRHKLRDYYRVLWEEYLYEPRIKLLWFMLDDSIKIEYKVDFCPQSSKYPQWIWQTQNPFILSFWWSAIRNSCVNWNNWRALKLGKFQSVIKSWGVQSFEKLRQDKEGYRAELRQFKNGQRYYIEFYLFGRYFECGWKNGKSPKFEIDLFKDK